MRTLNAGTFPAYPKGERGVLESYLRAIANARQFIYIENQYFTNDTIVDALTLALKRTLALKLIMVLNIWPDIPFYDGWQRARVDELYAAVGRDPTRMGVFTLWSHSTTAVPGLPATKPRLYGGYVHSKVAIVDNIWATVGSANLDGSGLDLFQTGHVLFGDVCNR